MAKKLFRHPFADQNFSAQKSHFIKFKKKRKDTYFSELNKESNELYQAFFKIPLFHNLKKLVQVFAISLLNG